MASTFTVNDALVFCKAYIKQQPVFVNNMQPGLGAAQIILNRILGAPCVWRFNRSNFSISISQAGGTDYTLSVPDLGFIETQWLMDSQGGIYELEGQVTIAKGSAPRRPSQVAPQYDDNAGNITWRFNAPPNANYTAYFDYQRKAQLITSDAVPLGIPDEYADLFFTGVLTWAGMLNNDSRFPIWERMFISRLLAAQDGLDDQAKTLLIGDWLNMARTVTRSTGAQQAANAGRQQ